MGYWKWHKEQVDKLLAKGERLWEVVISKDDPFQLAFCPECKQRCEVREAKICNYDGEYEQWTECCHVSPLIEEEDFPLP